MEVKSHLKSFERVHNYPIVNDSFLFALSYYQWAKSKNSILDVTLTKLEETLRLVKDKTEPFAAEKFHYVDETVFNQLEKLEKLCPIILESSNTIKSIPANIYHQRIEPTMYRITEPVSQTLGFIAQTSRMATYVVSSIATQAIPSGILPIQTTNKILNKTEELIDKYLPEQNGENCHENEKTSKEVIISKLKRLSKKMQHRIYKKVINEINHFKTVSFEKLEQIKHIIKEIKHQKSSVCKDTTSNNEENNLYRQLIKDGVYYSEYLQQILVSTAKSVPSVLCTGSITVMDLLNEKLFYIRNTILESSNQNIVSEKRLQQAADSIDFMRSWIEYVADTVQEYYNIFEKRNTDRLHQEDEEELPESESNEHSSGEEEEDEEDSDEE